MSWMTWPISRSIRCSWSPPGSRGWCSTVTTVANRIISTGIYSGAICDTCWTQVGTGCTNQPLTQTPSGMSGGSTRRATPTVCTTLSPRRPVRAVTAEGRRIQRAGGDSVRSGTGSSLEVGSGLAASSPSRVDS